MRPLTKKYIFKRKLAGLPIDLTKYQADDDWDSVLPLLLETGIVSLDRTSSISIRSKVGDEKKWVQYPIILQGKGETEPTVWLPRFL